MSEDMEKRINSLLKMAEDLEKSAKQKLKFELGRYNEKIQRVNCLKDEALKLNQIVVKAHLILPLPDRMMHTPEICVESGKRKYNSSEETKKANRHCGRTLHSYFCEKCKGWHATKA